MHPHHARALRKSRGRVKAHARRLSWALDKYEVIRLQHIHAVNQGLVGHFDKVKLAHAAMQQVVREYLDELEVAQIIERALEKA